MEGKYFCPHCDEEFNPWREGLNISCKDCYDFYESSEAFQDYKKSICEEI